MKNLEVSPPKIRRYRAKLTSIRLTKNKREQTIKQKEFLQRKHPQRVQLTKHRFTGHKTVRAQLSVHRMKLVASSLCPSTTASTLFQNPVILTTGLRVRCPITDSLSWRPTQSRLEPLKLSHEHFVDKIINNY